MRIVLISLLCLGLLGLAARFFVGRMGVEVPEHIGMKDGRFAPLPSSPNAVSSQTDDKKRFVEPLPFRGDLPASLEHVRRALVGYGDIEIIHETERYIHAVSTTGFWRFRDDLEFYFDEEARVIHFRSQSRLGHSDFGKNRERYEALSRLFQLSET